MSFVSKNEIEKFSFEDCELSEINVGDGDIRMIVEALRVLPNNSQNTNYTESYADTAQILIHEAEILSVAKEGYKYYDANDVLKKDVPDEEIDKSAWKELIKSFEGAAYLAGIEKKNNDYILIFETVDELMTSADSYKVTSRGGDITVTWDKYKNRVEH